MELYENKGMCFLYRSELTALPLLCDMQRCMLYCKVDHWGSSFVAANARELGSHVRRQDVGEKSFHRYVILRRLHFAKLTRRHVSMIILYLSTQL
jgi:hypothetical protein